MISFFVPGIPTTKGSSRAFVVGGRAVITNDAKRAKPWASTITLTAREAMTGRAPLDGPVRISIRFYLPRPKSHCRSNGQLKPAAPTHARTKPDLDKLVRCAWDALSGVAFGDDSQIVLESSEKLYAVDGRVGAEFSISALNDAGPLFQVRGEQV